ncbi:MAG: PatB family C-S lyase [Deltaproteobacteria bacterium]|nr:PatB family C-S lyase [Deltaproteobacteria bacterium]
MKYDFDETVDRESSHCLKYDFRKQLFGTKDVLPMWVADMEFKTPDFVVEAVKKRAAHEIYGYSQRPAEFYDAARNWVRKRHEWEIENRWISFAPGVVPALSTLIMALTSPGDKVITQLPAYPPFMSTVQNHGRQLINNPLNHQTGRYRINFEDLEQKIDSRVKMILLSSPHNPSGRVWEREELIQLAEICLANDIIIVSDEIHSDLVFKPYQHIPMATLSDKIAQKTITCIAPSKTFNMAGLSTSVIITANPKYTTAFDNMLGTLHIQWGTIFSYPALAAAYNHGSEWLEQLLGYLEKNIDFALDFIDRHLPLIKTYKPEASYLLWLDCRAMGLDDGKLFKFMVEKARVGLNNCIDFGTEGRGFMRLNAACSRKMLHEALARIAGAVK